MPQQNDQPGESPFQVVRDHLAFLILEAFQKQLDEDTPMVVDVSTLPEYVMEAAKDAATHVGCTPHEYIQILLEELLEVFEQVKGRFGLEMHTTTFKARHT
jgi:hypothetical protein